MNPEQIMAAILAANRDTIQQQAVDAFIYGHGYSRTTADGAQHVPRSEVYDEVIEGEFRVIEL